MSKDIETSLNMTYLKEKGLHGRVDERVSKKPKTIKTKGQDNHIVVPEEG